MSAAAPHVPNSPGCRATHNCLHPSLFSPECNYFKQQNPGLFYSNPKTHHFYSRRHFPRPCFKHPTPQPLPALAYATGKPLNFRRSTSQNLPPFPPPPHFVLPLPPFSTVCACLHVCMWSIDAHESVHVPVCVDARGTSAGLIPQTRRQGTP